MADDLHQRYAALRSSVPAATPVMLLHIGADQTQLAAGTGPQPSAALVLDLGTHKTAAAFFKHNPPTPGDIENAIQVVEDEVTRARPLAAGLPALFTHDAHIREMARLTGCADGAAIPLTTDQVERLFDQLAARVQGRPASQTDLPDDPAFYASLLILREFLHHLQFAAITVLR